MTYFIVKALVSGLVIAGASEIAKKATWLGALLISLPMMSILSMIWLYRDTGDVGKVIDLSRGIFLAIIPSLAFFFILPALLRAGWKFGPAMLASCAGIFVTYTAYAMVLKKLGISI